MKRIVSILMVVSLLLGSVCLTGCKDEGQKIIVALDSSAAPITVENFLSLVDAGFYDGLTFHRIIPDFMVQGGDPKGNGTGSSANTIKGEFAANGVNNPLKHERGVVSMARSNSMNSASCQFFICHQDAPHLDGQYAAFGFVVEGIEVVDDLCDYVNENPSVLKDYNGGIYAKAQPIINYIKRVDYTPEGELAEGNYVFVEISVTVVP